MTADNTRAGPTTTRISTHNEKYEKYNLLITTTAVYEMMHHKMTCIAAFFMKARRS